MYEHFGITARGGCAHVTSGLGGSGLSVVFMSGARLR